MWQRQDQWRSLESRYVAILISNPVSFERVETDDFYGFWRIYITIQNIQRSTHPTIIT